MSDVDRIVGLLASDAVEKRIAAAIVLGEIRAKGAGVADALAGLVERRVRALARAGAPPQLVLAGGRVAELAARLWLSGEVAGIMVEEHLVLRGLWLRANAGRLES